MQQKNLSSFSYLKLLLKPFNEMVEKFLEQIKHLADGKTEVPMKVHFGELTQNVISKVYIANHFQHL